MSIASGTLDANTETIGPVNAGRLGVSYQVDITGTITVTLKASINGGAYMAIGSGLSADAIGNSNIPGAAYILEASGVSGGSAICSLIAPT